MVDCLTSYLHSNLSSGLRDSTKWAVGCCLILTCFLAKADNLSTCLSGKYPSLCNKSLLTESQRQQALAAERTENLNTCLTGKYPSLCRRELLTADESRAVQQAERRENLSTCLTGKYTALCNRGLLTAEERSRVLEAEKRENLATCLTGRYSALCNKGMLTTEQRAQTEAAEKRFQQSASPPRAQTRRRSSGGCESGHWVQEVMSDGGIVKLEDGSVWAIDPVDQVDTMLWLPVTDIVVCPGKLINTDDNETAGAVRLR